MIKHDWLKLEKEDQPSNIIVNPLLNHRGGGNTCVNMVKVEKRQTLIDVNKVRTHMKVIFEILIKTDVIKTIFPKLRMQLHGSDLAKKCEYH